MFEDLIGKTVLDDKGFSYQLTKLVGWGGQGAIYEEKSRQYVIKIIHETNPVRREEIKRRYRALLKLDIAANASGNKFIMPKSLLLSPHVGYVMERVRGHGSLDQTLVQMPDDANFSQWYNQQTGGLRKRLAIGGMIARAFRHLDENDLTYCDLSPANILVAKGSSDYSICVIDPDNLSESGLAEALVMGTPRFMAPEVLKGSHQPDAFTDRYSLAVILFHLLRLGHPLLGDAILDGPPENEEKALRGELPFVEHPTDNTNRSSHLLPVGLTCTEQLQKLFQRAFVEGLEKRRKRPLAAEWEEACFAAFRNLTKCEYCAATFYPRRATDQPKLTICPWCEKQNQLPPILTIYNLTHDGTKPIVDTTNLLDAPYLVLQSGSNKIPLRLVKPDFTGEKGDAGVAYIIFNKTDSSFLIEKFSEGIEITIERINKTQVALKPKIKEKLQSGDVIFFDRSQINKLTRAARIQVSL